MAAHAYETERTSRLTHLEPNRVAFNVWQYGSFETPPGVECGGITFSQPDGTMANLLNGRCNLSSREFNLTFCDRGATLRVTGPVSIATNLTGETLLPLSNWKLEKNNMATFMSYHGPAELELAVV